MFLDKHIFPMLGDTLLTDVTPAMISKLLVDFQKAGYAHTSCVKLYNILNGIFEMAFLDDSIPMNPLLKVKRPAPRKGERAQEETKALTAKELAHVLSCVENEPMKWRVYMNLAADSGARRGELCGLWWSDVDWKYTPEWSNCQGRIESSERIKRAGQGKFLCPTLPKVFTNGVQWAYNRRGERRRVL